MDLQADINSILMGAFVIIALSGLAALTILAVFDGE